MIASASITTGIITGSTVSVIDPLYHARADSTHRDGPARSP